MKYLILTCLLLCSGIIRAQEASDARNPFQCAKVLLAKTLQEHRKNWAQIFIETDNFWYLNSQGNDRKFVLKNGAFEDEWNGRGFIGAPNWFQLDEGEITFTSQVKLVEKQVSSILKHQSYGPLRVAFKIERNEFTGKPLMYHCHLRYLSLSNAESGYEILEIK